MNTPNLKEERALFKKGCRYIAGIDEAGRGPLAGPVVSATVVFERKNIDKWLRFNIKDSKKLSEKQRKRLFKIIKEEAVEIKSSRVSEKVIDKINIRQATLLAMRRAFLRLKTPIDFVLIDGKDTLKKLPVNQKAIVSGDGKSVIIAAASVIAKETRDDIMRRYAKKYPEYGFERHKGYGTKLHRKMIKKYGPCKIHRKSFRPIKDINNQ
jgi:ribonuclease HII